MTCDACLQKKLTLSSLNSVGIASRNLEWCWPAILPDERQKVEVFLVTARQFWEEVFDTYLAKLIIVQFPRTVQ